MRSRQSLEVLDNVLQGRLHSILTWVVGCKIDQLCLQAGRLKVTPIESGDLHFIGILFNLCCFEKYLLTVRIDLMFSFIKALCDTCCYQIQNFIIDLPLMNLHTVMKLCPSCTNSIPGWCLSSSRQARLMHFK